MLKDTFKSLIALGQSEMPYLLKERDLMLPIKKGQIITIPGVRRCGKSSILKLTINSLLYNGVTRNNILWIGFDDERFVDISHKDLDDIITAYMEMFPKTPIKDIYIFFDEIQLIKNWELFVLRIYKNYCKNIYLSGSNAQLLSSQIASALRGWPVEYMAHPLSFIEYCRFNEVRVDSYLESDIAKLKNTFLEYNKSSAFPEVVLIPEKSEKIKKLQSYFNTMLYRDLVDHFKIEDSGIVRYFLKRIMANLSKPTSINSIFNDLKSQGYSLNKDQLYLWAEQACEIFLFYKVSKWDRSLKGEKKSLNKYYCIDNGMRSAILLPQSEDDGKLLENTVCLHLIRNLTESDKIYYYKDKYECDFVIQKNDKIDHLVQATWKMEEEDTRTREYRGLLEASQATGCKNLTIVTIDEEDTIEEGGLTINLIPAWKFLR